MWQALQQAMVQLRAASPAFAVAAVLTYAIGVLIASLRWQRILRGIGADSLPAVERRGPRLRDVLLTYLSSIFVNNVTPGRVGGEVFRVAMLRRRTGIETKLIVASAGYDRLTDIIPLALLGVLSLPTLYRLLAPSGGSLATAGWVALGLALTAAALLGLRRLPRVQRWTDSWRQRLATISIRRQDFQWAVGFGFLLWAQDLLRLTLVAAALHVYLSPWQVIPLSMVATLGGLVPTIGGLGAVEGGLTAALCLFGVPLDKALAITALERGISYVLSTSVGGIVLMLVGGGELWQMSRKSAKAEGEAA